MAAYRNSADISLVGWSLGGIYAREVAKRLRSRVRQVVTIGSPFAGSSQGTNAALVYRMLNGRSPEIDAAMSKELGMAPTVPTTSIFSLTDDVVAWQACIQAGAGANTENVDVAGSHCGLGWNAEACSVFADRLRQQSGAWRRYAARIERR